MKIKVVNHQTWLSNYKNSELFHCNNSELNCTNFHVILPVLHDLSINNTYNTYPLPIIRIVNQVISIRKRVKILVLGIESESSAKALLSILELFKGQFEILFIDICNTPLMRIQASLSKTERKFVRTLLHNFGKNSSLVFNEKFDIIFSDLFLKQFAREEKIPILNIISTLLQDSTSAVILREYIGNIDEIINRWVKMKIMPSIEHLKLLIGNQSNFEIMLDELLCQFKEVGYVYPSTIELQADIINSNLNINNQFFNNSLYYRILHLGNKH